MFLNRTCWGKKLLRIWWRSDRSSLVWRTWTSDPWLSKNENKKSNSLLASYLILVSRSDRRKRQSGKPSSRKKKSLAAVSILTFFLCDVLQICYRSLKRRWSAMKSASIMGVVTSLVVFNFDIECDGSLSFILLLLVVFFEHLRVFAFMYFCGFEL